MTISSVGSQEPSQARLPPNGDAPVPNAADCQGDVPERAFLHAPTKRCLRCYRILPLNDFHKDKSKQDGHYTICKDCRAGKTNSPIIPDGYRQCKICGKVKFEAEFYKAHQGRQRQTCKECSDKRWGIVVQCAQCGKKFRTKQNYINKGNGRFCSKSCFIEWLRRNPPSHPKKRIKHICKICGAQFEVVPSIVDKGQGIYCSRKCTNKGAYSQIEIKCKICDKQFKARKGEKDSRQFCNVKCTNEWRKTQTRENNGNWQGGKDTFVCKQCGKPFERYASSNCLFCSRDCYHQWHQGENCHLWQGGISFYPYSPEFNHRKKNLIRARDSHVCVICGAEAKHVHHIDYDKQNCADSNLVSLCISCHAKTTTGDREYWRQRLTTIMKETYGYIYN